MVDLDFVTEDVKAYFDGNAIRAQATEGETIAAFLRHGADAIRSSAPARQIFLFSTLQCGAIALVAWIWRAMLGWAPDEFLDFASAQDVAVAFAVAAWTYLCAALAAYPIALFTAAMGAACFLKQEGKPSTVAASLVKALPNSARLWTFYIWDGWQTISRIGDNLPVPGGVDWNIRARVALARANHRAWKAGTVGMPAALSAGKGLVEAAQESILMLKRRSGDVLNLRGAYTRSCAFVIAAGIVAMIACYLIGAAWIGSALLMPIAVIVLLIRPIYVVQACQLYSSFRKHEPRARR